MSMPYWLIMLAILGVISNPAQAQSSLQKGKALLEKNCAQCHAINKSGPSAHTQAPPFRELAQRYPVEALGEALSEGLSTGHPDMPEFTFDPEEVEAILDYLGSIQPR